MHGAMPDDNLCESFCIVLSSGVEVYPYRVRNCDAGVSAFRISKYGNEKDEAEEVTDEAELRQFVGGLRYRARCKTKDGKRSGLYSAREPNQIRALQHRGTRT